MNSIISDKDLELILGKKFRELNYNDELKFVKTRVFVSEEGDVITAVSRNNSDKNYCRLRNVAPVWKKGDMYEYKIYIERKAYSLHKLVANAFPDICGSYSKGMVIHHKNLDHLNNEAKNLAVVTKKLHVYIHRYLNLGVISESDDLLTLINNYLDECIYNKVVADCAGLDIYLDAYGLGYLIQEWRY